MLIYFPFLMLNVADLQSHEDLSPAKPSTDPSLAASRLEQFENDTTRTSVPFLPIHTANEKEVTLMFQDAMAAKIKAFGNILDKAPKGASSQG
jgi:hypothetical protein